MYDLLDSFLTEKIAVVSAKRKKAERHAFTSGVAFATYHQLSGMLAVLLEIKRLINSSQVPRQ